MDRDQVEQDENQQNNISLLKDLANFKWNCTIYYVSMMNYNCKWFVTIKIIFS